MKKIKSFIIGAAVLLGLAAVNMQAQENPSGGTNTVTNPIQWPSIAIQTNWAIPVALYYDNTDKKFGAVGGVLYKANDNLWVGARATYLDGLFTTAGVQAQLQTTIAALGGLVNLTPFLESSTGLGQNSMYVTAGGGAAASFKSWQFKLFGMTLVADLGIVAGAEHVVNSQTTSYNAIFGGPLLHIVF